MLGYWMLGWGILDTRMLGYSDTGYWMLGVDA
jgi:hypothetical protein